jgi:hypothetical protein
MNSLRRWFIFTATNVAAGEVLKAIIRARPQTHVKYIDYLNEQLTHEIDRFKRLHSPRETTQAEEEVR